MNRERINEILIGNNVNEVFYNEKPIWIQEINGDIARIGFLDGSPEKYVYTNDLYENN